MDIQEQIENYIADQPEQKQADMRELHLRITKRLQDGKLWFLDGQKNGDKIINNPNIGYGSYIIKYANGTSREFYQVGMSANTTGISIYILGLDDKTFLARTYGEKLGKASVTGYCIKFKKLKDINVDILEEAIQYRFDAQQEVE